MLKWDDAHLKRIGVFEWIELIISTHCHKKQPLTIAGALKNAGH